MSEPIVPTGTNDSQEELKNKIAELEKKNKELENERDSAVGDKTRVVDELKESRGKLAELKEKLAGKQEAPKAEDIAAVLDAELAKRDLENAAKLKAATLDRFVKAHKDLSPDNDPTGLKLTAFKTKLSRFSTEGMTQAEQFMEVFEDAYRLLGKQDTTQQPKPKVQTSEPSISEDPEEVIVTNLTSKEKKVIERLGWTEEKYLGMKKKMPSYVAKLLKDF